MKLETWALSKINPYPNNPRKNENAVAAVAESIKQCGYCAPIIVDENGIILAGHTRLKALKKLGWKEAEVVVRDGLTEEQKKKYRLLDNKTGEIAEWDMESLQIELADMGFDGFDFGFEIPGEEPEEVVEDEFDATLPEEPTTKLGDIWQLGRHRLMCGDSTDRETVDRLMDGQKADMVFTDPPYGMSLDAEGFDKMPTAKGTTHKSYTNIIGDADDFNDDFINVIFDKFGYCGEIFLWGGDYYSELIVDRKDGSWVVWDKRQDGGMDNLFGSSFELCWSKARHKREIARVLWAGYFGMSGEDTKKRVHPTQKPVALVEWFFKRYSKENEGVVDLFGGSGSTLIACEQLNRTCYMMELDPKYCDVIVRRWEALTGETAVLLEA